jgi:hypothetical protein
VKIGKQPPADFVPALDAALSAPGREQAYFWHALPNLWWTLPYDRFLVERRVRMAKVIHEAWRRLTGDLPDTAPAALSIAELVAGGESTEVEFKSTLRTNLHTGQPDERIQLGALKTIAGFLNAQGGTMLVGIADNGDVLGLAPDGFPTEDKMGLHLVNLIRDRIGEVFLPYVHAHFEDHDGQRVLSVRCERGPKAAFVTDGSAQRFFVRGGNATAELVGASVPEYVASRFG